MNDYVVIAGKKYKTLLAITEEEQIHGLMHRPWPPPIMSFPMKEASIHKFWMKDTPSALDILFCKNNSIISIEAGIPFSMKFVGPNSKTDLIVEMPLGTIDKHGIKIGDSIELRYSIMSLAKSYTENFLGILQP